MGNFFTSTQVYNLEQLTREKFLDKFCERMKNGYTVCDDERENFHTFWHFQMKVNGLPSHLRPPTKTMT